jgi:hypothetical protein
MDLVAYHSWTCSRVEVSLHIRYNILRADLTLEHSVMKKVKMVIQVVGHARIPLVPRGSPELMLWYFNACHVYTYPLCFTHISFSIR